MNEENLLNNGMIIAYKYLKRKQIDVVTLRMIYNRLKDEKRR